MVLKKGLFMALLTIFLLTGASLGAQDADSDWFFGKPILNITFEGLSTVSSNDMAGVIRPYVGKILTPDLFRELQTKLYDLDYFDGLIEGNAQKGDAQGNSVIIRFKVQEKPSIGEIKFQGNQKISDMELQGVVKVKTGDLVSLSKIRLDEVALREHFLDKGFLNARITSQTEPDPVRKNQVSLIFQIEEGIGTTVKEIQFTGLSYASPDTLRGLMETKAQWFLEPGYFKEGKLAADIKKILAYYWDRGYVDAKVVEIKREASFDENEGRNFISLNLVIDEGLQYYFGGFEFKGNSLFTNDELMAEVRQTPGRILSKLKFDADYQRIQDLYWENGYIFNDFQKTEIREENKISYLVTIQEQPRAHIENIIIKGNTKTREDVILRELPIEEGDVFSKSRVLEGYENLLRLNFFQSVFPETPQGSAPGLMDLVINVEEANTAEVLFGITFSGGTEFPLSGQLKWQDRNFLGGGQTFGVETTFSPYSQNLSANFTETWFLGRRFSLGGNFSISHTLRTNILQNVDGRNAGGVQPDPYLDGLYVFTKDTVYDPDGAGPLPAVTYKAGDFFPALNPSEADISTYGLKTQYAYDSETGNLRSDENYMQYDDYAVSLGASAGYAFHTALGRFGLGTGWKTTVQYLTYDDKIYRPANEAIRSNLNNWQLENQWWSRFYWDTRNLTMNTSRGVYFSETMTLSGGALGGKTHYSRFDTKLEAFLQLVEAPIVEEYTFKAILRGRSLWQVVLAPFGGADGQIVAQPKDLLYMDGMINGRGWATTSSGYSFWSNTLEVRVPIVEQLLWFDLFADAFVFTGEKDRVFSKPLSLDQFQMSFGGGLRISNPQLPISIYFAKPFRFQENGEVAWQKGDGILGGWDLKFVFALGVETF